MGGAATMSDNNHPSLGVATGKGGVNGVVVNNTFMLGEYLPDLRRIPGGACYSESSGQVSVTGDTLVVGLVEKTGCTGVHFPEMTRVLTMRRK